eukprot:9282781-Alexandrium_andersonii.AAC.1
MFGAMRIALLMQLLVPSISWVSKRHCSAMALTRLHNRASTVPLRAVTTSSCRKRALSLIDVASATAEAGARRKSSAKRWRSTHSRSG